MPNSCRYCKKPTVPSRTMCEYHLIAQRESSRKYREKRVAEGSCVVCGTKPLKSKRYCHNCLLLYGGKSHKPKPCTVCNVPEHTRKDHAHLGLCWYCTNPVQIGSNLCPEHHEKRLERNRKKAKARRDAWRAHGKCIICGKPAVNKSRCEKHRKYAAEWEKRRSR